MISAIPIFYNLSPRKYDMPELPIEKSSDSNPERLVLIAKLFGGSTVLALVIKYAMPALNIAASDRLALGIILLPSLLIAIVLGLKSRGIT
ncbi:MAG: hypothetical protein LH631_01615 [Alkalinema sp. CAN_BIN05]|nr:hypothetical protein [Alkalinema sp. CAN_BIN05]